MWLYPVFRATSIILSIGLGGCSLYDGNQLPVEMSASLVAGEAEVAVPVKKSPIQIAMVLHVTSETQDVLTCVFITCERRKNGVLVFAEERSKRRNPFYQVFNAIEERVTWFTPIDGLSVMLTVKNGEIDETFRAVLKYAWSEWTEFEVLASASGAFAELSFRW